MPGAVPDQEPKAMKFNVTILAGEFAISSYMISADSEKSAREAVEKDLHPKFSYEISPAS